jgi:hypothetical protein
MRFSWNIISNPLYLLMFAFSIVLKEATLTALNFKTSKYSIPNIQYTKSVFWELLLAIYYTILISQ